MVQTFSDKKCIYSVDLMFAYIKMFKPGYVKVEVADFLHVLDYRGWGNPKKHIYYSPHDVLNNPKKYKDDIKRIKKADLKYPVIINKNYIIDGVHRLTKAYLDGKKYIKAYIFDNELLKKFIISKNKNWKKVDSLQIYDYIDIFQQRFT